MMHLVLYYHEVISMAQSMINQLLTAIKKQEIKI